MKSQALPVSTFGKEVLERYAARAPVPLSVRIAMEAAFTATEVDVVFEEARKVQYTREVLFSMIVDVMGAVVTRKSPSVNAELEKRGDTLPVSRKAFYDKLNGTEPQVAAALVHHAGDKAAAIVKEARGLRPELLPGYRMRILDGGHIAATERRLKILWGCSAGPLPGFCLVVLDPAAMVATDVIPCEDGHAQERSLTAQLLDLVQPGDCWVADRNFCTVPILIGIASRPSSFIIRQHANLPCHAVGPRYDRGEIETGRVYEQDFVVDCAGGTPLPVRRITVVLDTPTRDGDPEIHILTNVPRKDATAKTIARLYRQRWTVETAFADLNRWLNAEIAPLGYPKASLLGFCIGLMAYNILAIVLGALRAVHGDQVVQDEVSGYHIIVQARSNMDGLDTLLDEDDWKVFRSLTVVQIAAFLVDLVARISLRTIHKAKRGPKKPVPPRTRFKKSPHVSTHRLLAESKRPRS
jgi:hypothetical protein